MKSSKKFYVVWEGRIAGVYADWSTCKLQIDGFQGAKYKSFPTKVEAEAAFLQGYAQYYAANPPAAKEPKKRIFLSDKDPVPIWNSISVDAAWNSVTKVMEYQGVNTQTGERIFHQGPFAGATNNIGEFLAIVHGLAYLKKIGSNMPIYSDSITGIAWVRQKKHKSVLVPTYENEKVFDLLVRAENWLHNNAFTNPIIKWNTEIWGEIPADFGRK